MAQVGITDIRAMLADRGATLDAFAAWLRRAGYLSEAGELASGTLTDPGAWRGRVNDFARAAGHAGSPAVTSPRPTLAAGRPTLDPAKQGKRVIRNASGVIEEIGLNAMTARHREREASQREALDEAGRSGSCSCDLNKMCPEHARRDQENRDRFY